jgi:hypothetical protein
MPGRTYVDTLTAESEVQVGTGADRAALTSGPQGAQIDKALQVAAAFGAAGTAVAGNINLDASRFYAFVDASAANRLANLPASAGLPNGRSYVVQKTDSSLNTVTVTPDGGDTINGQSSWVLAVQYSAVIVSWNTGAGEWKAIGIGATGISRISSWKEPVQAATLSLGNITLAPAPASVDGSPISTGDRVAAVEQTTASENGIYVHDGVNLA